MRDWRTGGATCVRRASSAIAVVTLTIGLLCHAAMDHHQEQQLRRLAATSAEGTEYLKQKLDAKKEELASIRAVIQKVNQQKEDKKVEHEARMAELTAKHLRDKELLSKSDRLDFEIDQQNREIGKLHQKLADLRQEGEQKRLVRDQETKQMQDIRSQLEAAANEDQKLGQETIIKLSRAMAMMKRHMKRQTDE